MLLSPSAILVYDSRMPGRPKLLALKKRIADEEIEDEIFEAIAEGHSIQRVCEMFDISSRKMLYDWKKNLHEGEAKFNAARRISADAHAEKAGDALDDLDGERLLTGPEVSLAIGKMKYRQWLASVRDKEQYGAQNGAAVHISFGDLHMSALQSPGARPQIEGPQETLIPAEEYAEAEILSIEEAGDEASNDGEANAQTGEIQGPNTPLAVPAFGALAPELGELL